ncbi:MAG: alpha/beta fold hydrolase [Methanocorpusculum sp.]|nr:alpha/beta fold hydrolase [Methanocorpusculum sp.]
MDSSEKDKCPIIFLPGILGSRLYTQDGQLVWFSIYGISRNTENLAIENELAVKNNFTNLNGKPAVEREYGSVGLYLPLIDRLCADFPDREIYLFSYDFRKSCADTADKLNEQIEFILNNSAHEKVDVVGHSMGGLVISSYAEKYGTEKLNKIVTLGTPYEGAPNCIYVTVNGAFFGLPYYLIEQSGITREMVSKYPGVIELFPSVEYLKNHPFKEDEKTLSTEETENILRDKFGELYDISQAKIFSRNVNGAHKIAALNNSYFAVGKNRLTTISVIFKDGITKKIYSRKGDGDVPYDSGTMFGLLEKLGEDDKGRKRFVSFSVKHNNLLIAPEPLNWIRSVLS